MASYFEGHSVASFRLVSNGRSVHCLCNSATTAPAVTHLSWTAVSHPAEYCQIYIHTTFPTRRHTHSHLGMLSLLLFLLQILVPWLLFCQILLLCSCFWRSHFLPGVMMMLIMTSCSVIITLSRILEATLPLLLSYFFVVLKQFSTETVQRQRTREDRRQNGHNDWP